MATKIHILNFLVHMLYFNNAKIQQQKESGKKKCIFLLQLLRFYMNFEMFNV